jgi:hypothetical protein
MLDIAPPVGRPENSTGQGSLPYLYMWETRGNWLTAVEIFFWQVDEKQGLSSSIARSCEKYLKGCPDSIAAWSAFPFCYA